MTQRDLFTPPPDPDAPKPIRIYSNGYDVTDRMPLTRAELERQRAAAKANHGNSLEK